MFNIILIATTTTSKIWQPAESISGGFLLFKLTEDRAE